MDTNITSVVVYPDRARITRQGDVLINPGIQQLEIEDLSIHLDPDTLRVKARGSARARLLGLQVQKKYYTETPSNYVQDLEKQIENTQDEISRQSAQIDLVRNQRTNLDNLAGHTKTYAKALSGGQLNIEAQLTLLDKLRARAEKLETEILSLEGKRRTLERQLTKLKKQLDQVSSARPRQRYAVLVEFEVIQAGELSVELVYDVTAAGWIPLYDLRRLEEGGKPRVEFSYLAQVSQRTGENWSGISLTLSTARPTLAQMKPELDPWYIRPISPPEPLRAQKPERKLAAYISAEATSEGEISRDEAPTESELEFEAETALASVSESGTAVSFQVPGKVVVPADGEPHRVNVARFWLPPELDYVCAPKLVQAAYTRARLVNDSPYTLLPGSANIFVGEEYIGTSRLEFIATQGEFELFLGVEDRLKITRELKKRSVDKSLIGGKRRVNYGYEVKIQNGTGQEVAVQLNDQIPVSRHEEIKVRLESVEPDPSEKSELNILSWELTLKGGEQKLIRFDFLVEHPPEMQVMGLP